MLTKIATVGSCVTRDNFNKNFNPNYKDFFKLVLHQHQVSIPSLMSNKISYLEDESLANFSDFNKRHLKSECDKSFFKLIKEEQPEYLLLDLDADVNFGVIEIGDGQYFTNNPKFSNVSFLKKYNTRMKMINNPDAYYNMWKPTVDKFFAFLEKEVPKCKILLVKTKFIDEFRDGKSLNEIRKSEKRRMFDVDGLNALWDRLNNYIIDNFNVRVLDMTQKKYYLEFDHPWGAYYLHYEQDYYNDFINKLQQIVLSDIKVELLKIETKHTMLEKKVKFYENESFIHMVKRYLLKYPIVKKVNDILKRRNVRVNKNV